MRNLLRLSVLSFSLLTLATTVLAQTRPAVVGVPTAYLVDGAGTGSTLSNNNTFSTFATLTLPAGTYLLSGKIGAANNPSINSNDQLVNCVLWNGVGTATDTQVPLDGATFYNAGSTQWETSLSLQGSITFKSSGGAVTLQCQAVAESGTLPPSVNVFYWQLLAIPVTHLIQQTN